MSKFDVTNFSLWKNLWWGTRIHRVWRRANHCVWFSNACDRCPICNAGSNNNDYASNNPPMSLPCLAMRDLS